MAVGGLLENDQIVRGSWDDRPYGCSFGPVIHYNTLSFNLHFKTDSNVPWSPTSGPIEIVGYGNLPLDCHNTVDAECNITVSGMSTLTLKTHSDDSWVFTISGDIGDLLSYKTAPGGTHLHNFFPTRLDKDDSDYEQTYELVPWNSRWHPICHKMKVRLSKIKEILIVFIK